MGKLKNIKDKLKGYSKQFFFYRYVKGEKATSPAISLTIEDYENTNMVESLLAAKSEFDDDVIVSYSDILFEKRLLQGMMSSKADFTVSVDDNWKEYWNLRYGRIDFDTESLTIDEKDSITELGLENPDIDKIDARYIGLLKFSKEGLQYILQIMEEAHRNFEDKPWQQSGKTVKK